MQGFRATYTGPAPELPLEAIARTPVARPMICTGWTSEGQVQDFLCNTVYRDEKGGPGLFGMDFGLDLEQDVRPPSWADQVAGGDPLEGVREFGLASSRNTENHHVLLGWTRPTTARIEVMLQRRGPYPVGMYGPFSELGTEVKWFVAFSPIDVPMITITAFDAAGGVIWQEREEQVVPLRVSKVGGGAGTVLGYSTFDLSCGEACPHPPRPRIDCGTTCSTGVLPGFGLTLEALPAVGSRFVRWEGACEGVDPSCSVTVRRGTDVTAVFEPA